MNYDQTNENLLTFLLFHIDFLRSETNLLQPLCRIGLEMCMKMERERKKKEESINKLSSLTQSYG